ncbi:MAG: glycoside hydrolase family 5 protein [Fibrobacteria bacterium]
MKTHPISILPLFMLLISSCKIAGTDPDPKPNPGPDSVFAQRDFPSAKDLNGRLGKGINLGNALDAPKEGEWGVVLKPEYFRRVADSGFTTVRLPVRWSAHALAISPYTIDSVFMDRVIWAVNQALDNKLHVVMDIHHYDEIYANPASERKKFLALWKQIAERFAGYPADLLFEILNEPRAKLDAETWNVFLAEAIETIRVSNPKRTLVVGTSPWGGLSGLSGLKLPSDTNLIITVHYYDPHPFTHQGVTFEAGADAWLGTSWRATPIERLTMDNDIELIRKWAVENNRAIFMGEFGSNLKADSISRELWTHYIVRRFDSCGFSWALWNYASDFGIVQDTTEKWYGYLANALLHPERNPLLDSILKAIPPIDTSQYVVWEDFEDEYPSLPGLARRWAEKKNQPLDSARANWVGFYSDSSAILNPMGSKVRHLLDTTQTLAPFTSLIGNWEGAGRQLHLKARLEGSPYPGLGCVAGILGGWDSTFVDLTHMTAVQFRAKGRGEWFIEILTDSIWGDTVESWGHMSVPFILESDWKTYLFPVAYFKPKPYSRQAARKMTWEDVREKAIGLDFENGQSYGISPKDSLELWLDDVRLIGIKDEDLGF